MKKLIALLLVLLLLPVCAGSPAKAEYTPTFRSTQQFLEKLRANGLSDTDVWLSEDGDECVYIVFSDEDTGLQIEVFASFSGEDFLYLYVYNLIDFDESNLYQLYRACSDANWDSWVVRFYVDESDFSVTAEVDVDLISNDTGLLSYNGMANLVLGCAEAYKDFFAPYAK